jgi:hypothetical protein
LSWASIRFLVRKRLVLRDSRADQKYLHFAFDVRKAGFNVAFRVGWVLLHQNWSDQLVNDVFWSQMLEFLDFRSQFRQMLFVTGMNAPSSPARSLKAGRLGFVLTLRCSRGEFAISDTLGLHFATALRVGQTSSLVRSHAELDRADMVKSPVKIDWTKVDHPSFAFQPFPSRRSVVYGTKGVVASSQPLANQVGLEILRKGGNAGT